MREEKRIKRILKLIEQIWSIQPDLRFFQLLMNYTSLNSPPTQKSSKCIDIGRVIHDPYQYEDYDLENELKTTLKKIKKQT